MTISIDLLNELVRGVERLKDSLCDKSLLEGAHML